MAIDGAMAVKGGNWQIFSHMLASSQNTKVHLDTAISKISKQEDGTYSLTTANGTIESFDTVILAAPFQFSDLVIDPPPRHVPDQIPYVSLHVTLFATPHALDPKAFNLAPENKVPQVVLTTLPSDEDHGSDPNGQGTPGFFSISIVARAENPLSGRPENIYKIFSAQPVTPDFLSHILGVEVPSASNDKGDIVTDPNGSVTWIHKKLWHSYPYEFPRLTFEELELDTDLWYTSGIESFISTMETSARKLEDCMELNQRTTC